MTATKAGLGAMPLHIYRRGAVYWFRRGVPQALRSIIGKVEITFSLKTTDRRTAERLENIESLKTEAEFDRARRVLAVRSGTAPETELSDSEVWLLAQEWLHSREKQDDAQSNIDSMDARERLFLAGDPDSRVQVWLQTSKFLRERNINVQFDTPSYVRLAQRIREAMIEAEKRLIVRYSGQPATLNPRFANISAATPPNAGTLMPFEELLARFRREQKPGRSAKTEPKRAMQDRLFKSIIGAKTLISAITRDDARRLREAVRAVRKTNGEIVRAATSQQYWYAFSAVMKFAEDERLIERSPCAGLKIAGDGVLAKDRHKAFSAEDLEKIFEAPLFQGCVDDTRNWAKPGDSNPRGTRFWVILLGLYTGARGHEILQLTEDDVEYVNGTPALHFRKQTKTAASRRVIPIHPELIRLGFLEHVDQVRKPNNPGCRIFHDAPASKAGYYSDRFGAWFARFLDSLGITDSRKSYHSFRHSFEDAAKEAAIPQARTNAILGHSEPGMAGVYGSGFQLSTLAAEIAKIYPGLDLSRLRK